MSHLIIASIKANTLKADEYYRLLNDLKKDPEYDELALLYPDNVGSDLDEEVLCCKIGKLLSNAINLNSDFETELLNSDSLLDGIKKLFNKVKSSKDIIGISLNYAVLNYAENMFSDISSINLANIQSSQKLVELKKRLYNSKNKDNYSLTQECK